MMKINKPASIIAHSYVADYQGCGHIRVIFPSLLLNNYRIDGYSFLSTYGSFFIHDTSYYKSLTYLQFQRAATVQHYNIINHYLKNIKPISKAPLVYEIDDLLFDVPQWNRASSYYKDNEDNVKKIMSIVDGMIVSTNKLKEVYSKYCNNIKIIPNHLPKFLWHDAMNPNMYESKIRILYQGSDNHFSTKALTKNNIKGGDFNSDLINFIRKTSNLYTWVFMGGYPLELEDLKNTGKIEYHTWKNIFEYPSYVKNLKPHICIAPLEKNLFNECKCLVGETYVVTNKGIDKIKNIKVDDKIWQTNDFKKITSTVEYKNEKTLLLTTSCGYTIEGTPNHRIKCENNFEMLSDLKVGSKVNLSFYEFPELSYKKIFNKTFDEIVGLAFGFTYGFTTKFDVVEKPVHNIIQDLFSYKLNIHRILTSSMDINETIYNFIFKSPVSVIKYFLRGVFEASNIKEHIVTLNSKNYEFIKCIQFLLLGFGITSQIRIKNNIFVLNVTRRLMGNLYHGIIACDQNILKMMNHLYKKHKHVSVYNNENVKKLVERKTIKPRFLYDTVTSIFETTNKVYDIQVPENEYYLANGFVSHNSNIKNLEYVALGGAAVYTDIEPYKHCDIKVNSSEEMISKIEDLSKSFPLRYDTWKRDYDKVKDQLFWEENDNINKYINTYLNLFGKELDNA